MDKATRILAIPLTSASYPESMDDLLDTISFHWRDSNASDNRIQSYERQLAVTGTEDRCDTG